MTNRPGRPGRPYLMTPRGLAPKRSTANIVGYAIGVVIVTLIVAFAIDAALAAIGMLIFRLLHDQVSASIPAFGFWQCFVILIALNFFKVLLSGTGRKRS